MRDLDVRGLVAERPAENPGGVRTPAAAQGSTGIGDAGETRRGTLPALPGPRHSPVAGNVGDRVIVATGGHNGPRNTTWELRQ